ncbi:hypothetical protein [Rhodococcoides navarretei]|uniref:Uncharacterized protein n=1 Tax=Rhodococcus navarretei TaxID=3128981 RepID=A0ABU9CSP5_9NOCA
MSEFSAELNVATAVVDPSDYIAGVKLAVRREFERIDETADLVDTSYFNHSAVPDFVIKWPDKTERRLYLRNSYESIVAANDAVRFNDVKPFVLALRGTERHEGPVEAIERQSQSAPDTLISDPESLDAVSTLGAEESETPVGELIRANLARGGRGLLTSDRVHELMTLQNSEPEAEQSLFSERLSAYFLPEAAAKITRTARLIQVALSSEEVTLPEDSHDVLNVSEMRTIVPWLLQNPDVTESAGFWRYVGSMFSFSDLIEIKEALEHINLSPLVGPNLSSWSGSRASIGLEQLASDNATQAEIDSRADGVWAIYGSTLGVNFGGSRLHLAPSGKSIRGRGGKSAVLWPELTGSLDKFRVSSVSLKGISRSIRVNAEGSDDVSEDVESITESVDDIYYVRSLGLAVPAADSDDNEVTDVHVDFDASIVFADKPVTLAELSSAALRVLRYREPVEESTVEVLTGAMHAKSDAELADPEDG